MNSETISINDFHSICRICLVSRENMTPYSTAQIIHMIEECTSIQVSAIIRITVTDLS